jgi:hypothetical protein
LFYARFEKHDFSEDLADVKDSLASDSSNVFDETIFSSEIVTDIFKRLNVDKAPGPDGICGRTLRLCAEQLGVSFITSSSSPLSPDVSPNYGNFLTLFPFPKSAIQNNPMTLGLSLSTPLS